MLGELNPLSTNLPAGRQGTQSFSQRTQRELKFMTARLQDLYYHPCRYSFVCAFVDEYHASGNIIFLIAVVEDRF
jgi:hypothetical protein